MLCVVIFKFVGLPFLPIKSTTKTYSSSILFTGKLSNGIITQNSFGELPDGDDGSTFILEKSQIPVFNTSDNFILSESDAAVKKYSKLSCLSPLPPSRVSINVPKELDVSPPSSIDGPFMNI